MKSKIMIIALLAVMFVGVQRAEAQVRKWEAEIGVGAITPSSELKYSDNNIGWNLFGEVRRNLGLLPLDLGLRVDGNLFSRKYNLDSAINAGSLEGAVDYLVGATKFKSLNVMAVADLNLLREKGISFFVGLGAGYGWVASEGSTISTQLPDSLKDKYDALLTAKENSVFTIMPRVGVELFHFLRATLYYTAPADKELVKEHGHFGVSLGVVFGGGVKNKSKKKND